MGDEAALVLETVNVNGEAAQLMAFTDRLLLVTMDGTRRISTKDLARISHKAGMRTGRIEITTVGGEQLVIKGLRSRDVRTAYRILVRLASAAQA